MDIGLISLPCYYEKRPVTFSFESFESANNETPWKENHSEDLSGSSRPVGMSVRVISIMLMKVGKLPTVGGSIP